MTTKTHLDGIVKRAAIEVCTARAVRDHWQIRAAVKEAQAWLQKTERSRYGDVERYVREAFAAAAAASGSD